MGRKGGGVKGEEEKEERTTERRERWEGRERRKGREERRGGEGKGGEERRSRSRVFTKTKNHICKARTDLTSDISFGVSPHEFGEKGDHGLLPPEREGMHH